MDGASKGLTREILLCDLDAFFAAVEQRDRPELRGLPVIIGGSPETRGVVSTCSYEARRYGVHSAMPMRRAVQLCPRAVFLPGNMPRYAAVSRKVMAILERFTPDIEPVSIDEAYLAVPPGSGLETAGEIRRLVRAELDLPISAGVSVNKLLAKIACDLAKPDGRRALWPEDVPAVLWPMPVRTLPGIGPAAAERLHRAGLNTVGDLAAASAERLTGLLGSAAPAFHAFAHGRDDRELALFQETKSVSEETTFPQDVSDPEEVLASLMELSEGVGFRLRAGGWRARTISMKLRFADFKTITRDSTLRESTARDSVIYRVVRDLFTRHRGVPPWRLVGVRASGLERWEQLSLLPPEQKEIAEGRVGQIQDTLRRKYGRDMLFRARRLPPGGSGAPGGAPGESGQQDPRDGKEGGGSE